MHKSDQNTGAKITDYLSSIVRQAQYALFQEYTRSRYIFICIIVSYPISIVMGL